MFQTVCGIVRNGKIELTEDVALPEGARLLVTLLPDEEDSRFWELASQASLDAVWDNAQDDVYAKLLAR